MWESEHCLSTYPIEAVLWPVLEPRLAHEDLRVHDSRIAQTWREPGNSLTVRHGPGELSPI
jgi:hypothetical protein